MGELLSLLVDLVCTLWFADEGVRNSGHLGESPTERDSRLVVRVGFVVALVILGAAAFWLLD